MKSKSIIKKSIKATITHIIYWQFSIFDKKKITKSHHECSQTRRTASSLTELQFQLRFKTNNKILGNCEFNQWNRKVHQNEALQCRYRLIITFYMFKPSQFEKWTFASTTASVFLIEFLICPLYYVRDCSILYQSSNDKRESCSIVFEVTNGNYTSRSI